MTRAYLVTNMKSPIFQEAVKYTLLSFYYVKDDIQYYLDWDQKIFVDCGAFSHSKGTTKPDIEEYASFCHKYGDQLDCYANMDVIGDPESTYENQLIMEDLGLHPVPVFHRGDDWQYLIDYLKGDHDYIALGGVADPGDRWNVGHWMGKVVSLISEHNPTIKTHAFGVTSLKELLKYRFYSCDSSTWADAMKFNKYQRYVGNGILREIDVENSKEAVGFHFGDCPLEGKVRHSVTAWMHMVDYMSRITPSSEKPFTKDEIDQLQ